ncbi:hypothetical protein, partial [uncultured Prevotella sp.]|uniref:hypothetical protein n=1 Tax=uncultured Prevotella sp. TaxID=159272 RepID=UPI0027E325B9
MMQKELIQVLRKILDFSYQELFITLANIQKVQEKKHTHCKKNSYICNKYQPQQMRSLLYEFLSCQYDK